MWTVEKEDRNLLIGLLPDIHCPMHASTRLLPIKLSQRDLDTLALAAVAIFD